MRSCISASAAPDGMRRADGASGAVAQQHRKQSATITVHAERLCCVKQASVVPCGVSGLRSAVRPMNLVEEHRLRCQLWPATAGCGVHWPDHPSHGCEVEAVKWRLGTAPWRVVMTARTGRRGPVLQPARRLKTHPDAFSLGSGSRGLCAAEGIQAHARIEHGLNTLQLPRHIDAVH